MAFTNPPAHATFSEEGWMIIGEEAFTESEWNALTEREAKPYRRPIITDEHRLAEKRRKAREYQRRKRAKETHT